ncbi:ATP-dependent DNA helicase [Aphis craccivora]|uniref:ATP-dependent DNA helicase n=1 Tax=Aphis craccivora TaxID=307492 RepID=A0A6G0VRY9_APHCR|nr:ATP-dependent DNA helicase [Aphis craccivora]
MQRRLEARRFVVVTRRANDRQCQQATSTSTFEYGPDIKYYAHSKVEIGAMDKECSYCNSPKFKNGAAGMCCASEKWLTEKAIMAVKSLDVNDFNFKIHQLLPGDLVSYKSIDKGVFELIDATTPLITEGWISYYFALEFEPRLVINKWICPN